MKATDTNSLLLLKAISSLIAGWFILFAYPVLGDTIVIPATGGNNLCVGGDYVSIGDITVKEEDSQDFEKEKPNQKFVLAAPANFEFKSGVGSIVETPGSSTITLHSIVVTSTEITITYSLDPGDTSFEGFVIKGIQVRAVGIASTGNIVRKNSPPSAKQKKNDPPDKVSHGYLTSVLSIPPIVALSSNDSDNTICSGESVTFTASSITADFYEFFVDGVSKQSGTSNTYTTTSLTNGQTTTVKATTINGCASGVGSGITTIVKSSPSVTLSSNDADNSICPGQSVAFIATSATATNYEFFVGGVTKQNSASNEYITNTLIGGQTVLVIASVNGCSTASNSITFTVNITATATTLSSSDSDNTICSGESVIFKVTSPVAAYYEFFIDGTSVQNSSSDTYNASSLLDGQAVTAKAISTTGCPSTLSNSIETAVYAPPTVTLNASKNKICTGETVTFKALPAGLADYEFFVDGESQQSGTSDQFTVSSLTDGQSVTVKAANSVDCAGTSSGIAITVSSLAVTLTSSDADNQICAGESVKFTASSSSAVQYEFFVDGTSVQSSNANQFTTNALTNGQTVVVQATNAGGCSVTSNSIVTTVNSLPPKPMINIASGSLTFCQQTGNSVTLQSSASAGNQWYKNGLPVPGATTQLLTLTNAGQSGNYQVQVTGTTPTNCTSLASDAVTISISENPDASLPVSYAATVCEGSLIKIDIRNSQAGIVYTLYQGAAIEAGPIGGTGGTISFLFSKIPGTYHFVIQATNLLKACSVLLTDEIDVTVQARPKVTLISSNNTICAGELVTFTAKASSAVSTYEFFLDGTSVQNSSSDQYVTTSLTNGQTVIVTARTVDNCEATSNPIATAVTAGLTVILTSSDGDNSVCAGEPVTFTANAPTATNYAFFLDGVEVQNSATNIYTTNTLTNGQSVTVAATTASGCTATSAAIPTTVYALPTVILTGSDSDNSICNGEQVTFTATSATATQYEFFVDATSVQTGIANQYVTTLLNDKQIVTVSVISDDGCSAVSNGIKIEVKSLVVTLTSSDADNTICPGEPVTFTATASVADSYEFFVNGASVQNSVSNQYTSSSSTNGQTVTVTARTATGCQATSSGITTFVNVLTVALTSSDGDNSVCAGEPVTFTANAPTATNYAFFLDGVEVQNSATNIYTTNTLTNGQSVTVAATTASGCTATSAAIPTTVYALPTVILTGSDSDNSICNGEQVTFTATSATATQYEFFVDATSVQTGIANQYVTTGLTNGQTVRVRAYDVNGCSALSNLITTAVNAVPTVVLTSNDPDNTICPGQTVTFTADAPTATAYEFLVNGVPVQTGATNIYSTDQLTNGQTVRVRVTTATGCSAVSSGITVTVQALTVTLTSSDADNNICPGESVTFTAASATATQYEFFVNGAPVQNSASPTYATSGLTDGQTVTVKATVGSCTVTSNTIATQVKPLTVALTSNDPDNRICLGTPVTFTANPSAVVATHEFFVDGISKQSGASATYTTTELTNGQTVSVKARAASGCEAVSSGISTTVEVLTVLLNGDPNNQICNGETVTFIANAPTATNYEFFLDNVSVQNSATNVYTVQLTNGQTVQARVTNAYGCTAISNSVSTIVSPLPTVMLTSSDANNSICAGESVTFTAASATATQYEFFVNGVSVQKSATNIYTTTTLADGQNVQVKVTTADGCTAISNTIITSVNPLPTVILTSSDTDNQVCDMEPVTFTANSPTATKYEFFLNGTLVQNGGSNQYITTALSNGQTVRVRVTTADNCSAESNTITTIVYPLPTVTLTSNAGSICEGSSVIFTANSATATNYEFFLDGVSVQKSATNQYATTGLTNGQTVRVQVTTASGCTAISNNLTTTVYPLPTVTLASSDADNSICAGESVTFTATSATAVNYKFYVDGALVKDGAAPTYTTATLTNGQTVRVRVATSNGCTAESNIIATAVNPLPTVSLTSSDADNSICAGELVTFTATSATATQYEFFVNGVSVQKSATNQYATTGLTNGQTVIVKVFTADECRAESNSIPTTVYALPTVTLISSDADNVVCDGEMVTFTASSPTATNYEFFIDGISKISSNANSFTTKLTSGQTVIVLVKTANGCTVTSSSITTTVNPITAVNAGKDQVVCANEIIKMNGAIGGAASSAEWSGGEGSFSDAMDLNAVYIPGVGEIGKTITLTLTTNDPDDVGPCASATDQVMVTIHALPNVLYTGLQPEYCVDAPDSELIGFPVGGTFSGDGVVAAPTSSGYAFSPLAAGVGTHMVRYTFTDGNNCINYQEKMVIVHPLPFVFFTGFNNAGPSGEALYPQDAPLVYLTGTPAGGSFAGTGISSNTFSASAAGAGTYLIRYTFTNTKGCTSYQEQTVTVAPLPNVGIENMPGAFCSNEPEYMLKGTPVGGTFSGPGVDAAKSTFKPANAFIGLNVIRYTFTDELGGTNHVEKTVTVNEVPKVTFGGLSAAYCRDAAEVTLTGFPADDDGPGGKTGEFKGAGILSGTNVFSPPVAGVGTHTITYVFTDLKGCTDSSRQVVVVRELPMVSFGGLEVAYCADEPTVKLTGFPEGGVFSGPGISGATFLPSVAGVGLHIIQYLYTDGNVCTNIKQQSVRVNPVPVADFSFVNQCVKDNVQFVNTSTVEGSTIATWMWNFGDAGSGIANTSTEQNPVHTFTTAGDYTIKLDITSSDGCLATKILTVTIGSIPLPGFTWTGVCLGEPVQFTHQTSLSVGEVVKWDWEFGDGSTYATANREEVVSHRYQNSGNYAVTLKVTTGFACTQTVTQPVFILPSVQSYPYVQNFESGAGGWVADGNNVSWQLGTPAGEVINQAASGQNAWMTKLTTGYNADEQSFVYSPCYDFTQLQRPVISLNIWNHTQKGFDGAVLQASVDGGGTWENVGRMGAGVNWFDQAAIVGNPGNQSIGQVGWSGTDTSWRQARYVLDAFKGQSAVRFRMAFGSNSDNPADAVLDGFAFDDVFIGERDRIVLLEHFTNVTSAEANAENTYIENLTDDTGGEVIAIQYHTNFPGSDPLNETNMADPSARALYYGVPQTPRTAVDGYVENQKFSAWGIPTLETRKLTETPFDITIQLPETAQNALNVSTTITAKVPVTDTLQVHVAVIEKQIIDLYAGAPVFRNVLRKMLPDAAGTRFTRTWATGTEETIIQAWEVMHVRDASQLAVVVFVQNERTKEVYQAAIAQPTYVPTIVTGLDDPLPADEITLFPNPANKHTFIQFPHVLTGNCRWQVFDVAGKEIAIGTFPKGQKQFALNTSRFAAGMYVVQLTDHRNRTVHKRLVIVKSR